MSAKRMAKLQSEMETIDWEAIFSKKRAVSKQELAQAVEVLREAIGLLSGWLSTGAGLVEVFHDSLEELSALASGEPDPRHRLHRARRVVGKSRLGN